MNNIYAIVLHESGAIDFQPLETIVMKGLVEWRAGLTVKNRALLGLAEGEMQASRMVRQRKEEREARRGG